MASVWIFFIGQSCVFIGFFALMVYAYKHGSEIRIRNWRSIELKPVHIFAIGILFVVLIVFSFIRTLTS